MTEETKVPNIAASPSKPPLSDEARFAALSQKGLVDECRWLTHKPKMEGAEAIIVLVSLLKSLPSGDDPYVLRHVARNVGGFNMYSRGKVQ